MACIAVTVAFAAPVAPVARRARTVARETMRDVREAMGLAY